MTSGFLADTNILTCWIADQRHLTPLQRRVLQHTEANERPFAISPITFTEIAFLATDYRERAHKVTAQMIELLRDHPLVNVLPITAEIALDVGALRHKLRDPMDCIIVATARVHGLKLMTLDHRIIDSRLVPVIE